MAFWYEVGGLTCTGDKYVYLSAYLLKDMSLVCHHSAVREYPGNYLGGTISELNLDILMNAVCILRKCMC